ncbi:MAG: CBS domain-containing protein [Euryarchaeota archaeon]|nr:CBS domain-containing protein [Euryarchaeota archaeon]MDE1835381.1 CBS domain-containing protein [Euryarchaeota archaeon]MDE1880484.1 CBS domain-containing protein [Euryarchaeota archaeon]MDE2043677.1 CBS domain-containing protein [Thermoplasmata archaeon]
MSNLRTRASANVLHSPKRSSEKPGSSTGLRPKVDDLMSRDVQVCQTSDSCAEVARRMLEGGIGMLPVLQGGEVVGIVTDRDLAVRGLTSSEDPRAAPVERWMTPKVVSVEPETGVDDAIRLMREHDIRRLVVTERGVPVGVLTLDDIYLETGRGSDTGKVVLLALNQELLAAPIPRPPP